MLCKTTENKVRINVLKLKLNKHDIVLDYSIEIKNNDALFATELQIRTN